MKKQILAGVLSATMVVGMGGGIVLIGINLIPQLATLFG